MLTNHSANAVFDLAEQVSSQNLRLSVIDESPITALLEACISPSMRSGDGTHISQVTTTHPVTDFIGASRLKGPEGASEHDLVMSELVQTIAGTVTRNLAWARNEVAPMVSSIYEQALGDLAETVKRGPVPLVILPYFYATIWDRPEITELATRHAHVPLQQISLVHRVGLPTDKSVSQLLMTGLTGVDLAINELISRCGESYIQEVYESVFGENRLSKLEFSLRLDSINFPVVTLLLANALSGHVPEGINSSLDGYKAYMAEIIAQSAATVARILSRRADQQANNQLVLELPSAMYGAMRRGNVIVNGDVYNRWLTEGGSPELLMGAILAGRDDSYQGVLAQSELNARAYQSVIDTLKSTMAFEKLNALISSFRRSMAKLINNLPEDELHAPRAILHQNLAWRLTHIKQSDLENPYIAARKVLCRTLWHHTDVEKYLQAIDAAAAAHPGMDVREAALFAVLDIVVEWLQSQIAVQPGG